MGRTNCGETMTLGVIATVRIKDGQGKAFETIFAEQAANVKANEPGNLLYKLFRARGAADQYVVMEMYTDETAFEAHRNGAHMALTRPRTAPLIEGKIGVTIYDAV